MLFILQNEQIDVAERVRKGLHGENKIKGIGQGILTALLHTFNNEKYGVWNSRTVDTLQKLRRSPRMRFDIGEQYVEVNATLHGLAKEFNVDLTMVDGFMWFISKNYEFL